MTFNIEPSVYIKWYEAVRHCHAVTVRRDGLEVLTHFAGAIENLVLSL